MKQFVKTYSVDIARVLVLILILASIIMGIQTSEAFSFRDMTLKFAQVSDVHLSDGEDTSYKLLSSSKDLLEDAVGQLNDTEGLDFVMFTGDMVNEPTRDNYRDFFTILSELKHPSLAVIGNHDFGPEGEGGLKKSEALDLLRKCNPNYVFDKSYYAFTPKKDFHIIVLDLSVPGNLNGEIPKEQLAFLDDEIKENPDKVIVIFQHYPIVEPFHSQTHEVKNAPEYLSIVQKYKNPILILSGHYHTTKIVRQGNIIHVSSPALITYPNAFRTVSITNYNDRTIFDFYFNETRLKELQEKSRLSLMTPTLHMGTDKDRLTTIVVKKK